VRPRWHSFYRETTGASSGFIAAIAIFSVLNGALIQIIIGLRVLYGMGAQGWLPEIFVNVGSRTQTPVFASANAVLIRLKRRIGDAGIGFRVPLWVPVVGSSVCSAFALYQIAGFFAEIARMNGVGHTAFAKLGPYLHICVVLDLDRLYFCRGQIFGDG
jgi:amino acid transporter